MFGLDTLTIMLSCWPDDLKDLVVFVLGHCLLVHLDTNSEVDMIK